MAPSPLLPALAPRAQFCLGRANQTRERFQVELQPSTGQCHFSAVCACARKKLRFQPGKEMPEKEGKYFGLEELPVHVPLTSWFVSLCCR